MRIVIDTNVLISGFFWEGTPRDLLQRCFSGDVQMVCTEEIFAEYMATLEILTEKYGDKVTPEIQSI